MSIKTIDLLTICIQISPLTKTIQNKTEQNKRQTNRSINLLVKKQPKLTPTSISIMSNILATAAAVLCLVYLTSAAPFNQQDVNNVVANSDVNEVEQLSDLEQFFKDQPHLNPNMGTTVTLVTAPGANKQDATAQQQDQGSLAIASILSNLPTNPTDMIALFTEMMSYLTMAQQFSLLGLPGAMEQLQAIMGAMNSGRTQLINSLNETEILV